MRLGGALMVIVGLLLITGVWARLIYQLQIWTQNFGAPI